MTEPTEINRTQIDLVLSKALECGDCFRWQGRTTCGVPVTYFNQTKAPVRRILAGLLGRERRGGYWYARCGDKLCVAPDHMAWRPAKEHFRNMVRSIPPSAELIRRERIGKTKRATQGVLTDEQRIHIITSDEPARRLAQKLGCSYSLVTKIRRQAKPPGPSPWAALL